MTAITYLMQQGEMAEAAYANFVDSSGNLIVTDAGIKSALEIGGFSETQATHFVNNWSVEHHLPNTDSGLFEMLHRCLEE